VGADLYLEPVYTENREQWEPLFYQAVMRRDKFPKGSRDAKVAQKEVERYFDKMHAQGYFRDPYNKWSVLWMLKQSWWQDVIPLLDNDARLSVAQTRKLLVMLEEQEPGFEERIAGLRKKDQRYFRGRYRALRKFLKEAIDRNVPVRCSL